LAHRERFSLSSLNNNLCLFFFSLKHLRKESGDLKKGYFSEVFVSVNKHSVNPNPAFKVHALTKVNSWLKNHVLSRFCIQNLAQGATGKIRSK